MTATVEGPNISTKPYTRWWWFSGRITKEDVKFQLDWLKDNHFGGVEIAWIYPLPGSEPGPRWLSEEWSELVAFTKGYAEEIELGCDFTFGTLWPFGGSIVDEKDASKDFLGLSVQRIINSWEEMHSPPGYVLNHLDHAALERYAGKMGEALCDALSIGPSALFCDSWEVDADMLWTEGFNESFAQRFGYDVTPYMMKLDDFPDVRYDYRRLLSDYVLNEFYIPYTKICNVLKGFSRVQCHGAPTDLVAAYSAADIPESEAILFDPHFSQFAASAATLMGKVVVSAESFTCLYGWKRYPGPGDFQSREQTADMKLAADALFANGINMIIWHGMPFNPKGGRNRFYATVHVGPDSCFADEIPAFNRYLERISAFMRMGKNYTDMAVYLPLEDNWMRGELPEELRRPSANNYWELQYQRFPQELSGYRPTWVSNYFLKDADYRKDGMHCGRAVFSSLYIDVEWLDYEALLNILNLADKGLPICLKRRPRHPGFNKNPDFQRNLARLLDYRNVKDALEKIAVNPPLVAGEELPEFSCRVSKKVAYLFFAHPQTKELRYPMKYGQSRCEKTVETPVKVNIFDRSISVRLVFEPYQSVLLKIEKNGDTFFENIKWSPKEPRTI
jgi:hypothetical protein